MAKYTPKSFQQILIDMTAKMAAETPITDFTDGSVVLTLLEAAAQEDFQQYIQMLHVIRNYNLDTTEGEDLDDRAAEYGLSRLQSTSHSGFVTISDTRFTKIVSKIYAGLPGPTSGSTTLNVDDASFFPATGQVYIGRTTANSEGPITYSTSPVDNGAFWTITLDTAVVNDHGTDETIILAQFGNRVIEAGTEVEIPESDFSERVIFELNQNVELLDGEYSINNILVTASESGGFSVPASAISTFSSSPFTGATVTNPLPFVNGRDEETDQELRDRIRDTIQSLSRGTKQSISTEITRITDEDSNSSVVSANIVPPVILADGPSKVYIDNGRGLEPSLAPIGLETVITSATGGEQFFQLQNFPIVKASLVSQNIETFTLSGGETIIVRVGINEETFTFDADDFTTTGRAEATEVSEAINNRAVLIEARTITTEGVGRQVIITPKVDSNENMQIDSASTAQVALNFSELEVFTLKLYKNDLLLTKDGRTASLLTLAQPFDLSTSVVSTTDADFTVTSGSRVVTKTAIGSEPIKQLVHPGDYIKFSSDSNIFYTKVKTIISDLEFILEEEYALSGGGLGDITIWNSPQLEVAANGDLRETEVVSFSPNDFATASQALASEVFTRMDAEINLSKVELSVNDTKVAVISELENNIESKIQVTGGSAAIDLGYTTTSTLTGTLSFTGGEKTVTGAGTLFTTELEEGQWVKADLDNKGSWTKIESIKNDTTLYFVEGYRGLDRLIGVASSRINFSDLAIGADKDYTLNKSNGQIELTQPLTATDQITAGSINTRAFVNSLQETYDFNSLGASSNLIVCVDGGFTGIVSTGDAGAPYDNFFASNLIGFETNLFAGFYIEWITGANKGETDFISTYTNTTGEFSVVTGFTNAIAVSDRFILCQALDFTHASDFIDDENATAEEVVTAINAQLLGALSEKLETNNVRIRTSNFGENGTIEIKGGSANPVLGFPTAEEINQFTNLAFVQSVNTDRDGNASAKGYTLGPDQSIVCILDGDSANKTFSITPQKASTTTAGGTGTFTDTSIISDFSTNNFFKDFWVYWTSGANEGSVQVVTDYNSTTGVFTVSDIFPAAVGAISAGDDYTLVARTAENVVAMINDFNISTFSISGYADVVGISGDYVQLATQTAGSLGKIIVAGGSANSLGISIQSIPAGAPTNDLETNSKAGLSKGLLIHLTVDGAITTGDAAVPYDSFTDTSMISSFVNYFVGQEIEWLTGFNVGSTSTIATYTNTTGAFTVSAGLTNSIQVGDTYRIKQRAYIVDIQGSVAPYTIELNDITDVAIDVSIYTTDRLAAIRDVNGFQFSTTQVEGIDGYKYYTGLIQKTQWTIDGLDRDQANYPGIAAAGTQFDVLTPVLVKLNIVADVTTEEGINLSSISSDIVNVIAEYINSRGVGEDVVLSEIVASAQSVSGVYDIEITNYVNNVIIADNELARIDSVDIVLG